MPLPTKMTSSQEAALKLLGYTTNKARLFGSPTIEIKRLDGALFAVYASISGAWVFVRGTPAEHELFLGVLNDH